ncbi:MAG: contractile injection system protein, VgrG/Pvc8 family [Bryobacteraceae bacterium]|jgi:phage protein D
MPDAGQAPAIYSSRPILTVSGQSQTLLGERLLELMVEETTEGLYRAEATFSNFDKSAPGASIGFLYFDRKLLDFGAPITIQMGAGIAQSQVFTGRIMALEARFPHLRPPEILVRAEDRLQDLRMTRRTRTFENIDDSTLFQQVASQQGLQANVNVSGPTYKVLAQVNQSDLAFLRERATAVDAELWVDDQQLNVVTRSQRSANQMTLTYGEGLFEFSAAADLALQATGFNVTGWDVSAKQPVAYRATSSALGGELNGDTGGSSILQQAIGQRDQQVVHRLPFSQGEAQALAEASYRRWARRFVTGNGIADGDGRIQVGTRLTLQQLGPLFDGAFYVTGVRHLFDQSNGYRTWFAVERAGIGSS